MRLLVSLVFVLFLVSCKTYRPNHDFLEPKQVVIDYDNLDYWAAHPAKSDAADLTPEGHLADKSAQKADVFFIHPTTYTGDKGQDQWNADLSDPKLVTKTNDGSITFQASVFNHAARVFAPRYRQAHLHAYFTKNKTAAKKAFDLAYADVKHAFEYYLKNENNDRPIIIAGHSQGTNHAERLLDDFFVNRPLGKKLIVAYLVGMPIRKNRFEGIAPCNDSLDTGCFVSWRTFKKGTQIPDKYALKDIAVTNPLSWKMDDNYIAKDKNLGTLLFDFDKIYHQHIDAQVHNDILWANKPKFFGSILLRTKNYHPADINFYYFNIRKNAVDRVEAFLND
jgi:Protein of unknown function (DUF3089)